MEELHSAARFPGATVGFVLSDGRVGAAAVGLADKEAGRAMQPTDRMFAGSVGKTFVAATILQLVDEGRARLDAPIATWLGQEPWFARLPNAGDITLRMLLNHTSGIPEHVLRADFLEQVRENPDKTWEPAELVAYILDAEPLFPAGKGFSYADTNYILVGMIIERITGATYYDEMTRRLLEPLQLNDTLPQQGRSQRGLVPGYRNPNDRFGFPAKVLLDDGRYVVNPQFEWTGGGVGTTALDLARWAKALYEGEVLSAAGLKEMLDAREADARVRSRYGLGVQVWEDSAWGPSYGHSGFMFGYLTVMEYWPQTRIAVAVQFNTDDGRTLGKPIRFYTAEVARVLQGEVNPEP